jgi:hypothetical protein
LDERGVIEGKSFVIEDTKLCPNCARQGQIITNNSKRNQKQIEKFAWNQVVKNTGLLNFHQVGLKILRPQGHLGSIPSSGTIMKIGGSLNKGYPFFI